MINCTFTPNFRPSTYDSMSWTIYFTGSHPKVLGLIKNIISKHFYLFLDKGNKLSSSSTGWGAPDSRKVGGADRLWRELITTLSQGPAKIVNNSQSWSTHTGSAMPHVLGHREQQEYLKRVCREVIFLVVTTTFHKKTCNGSWIICPNWNSAFGLQISSLHDDGGTGKILENAVVLNAIIERSSNDCMVCYFSL